MILQRTIAVTAGLPSVSVPVLSVKMTLTDPRVSTLDSLRTMALRAAIRCTPRARTRVAAAGSPSGIAATARLAAVRSISSAGKPRTTPTRKTRLQSAPAAATRKRPTCASSRCRGVS